MILKSGDYALFTLFSTAEHEIAYRYYAVLPSSSILASGELSKSGIAHLSERYTFYGHIFSKMDINSQ